MLSTNIFHTAIPGCIKLSLTKQAVRSQKSLPTLGILCESRERKQGSPEKYLEKVALLKRESSSFCLRVGVGTDSIYKLARQVFGDNENVK